MEISALNDKSVEKELAKIKKSVSDLESYGGMAFYNACLKANEELFNLKWKILFKKNFKEQYNR